MDIRISVSLVYWFFMFLFFGVNKHYHWNCETNEPPQTKDNQNNDGRKGGKTRRNKGWLNKIFSCIVSKDFFATYQTSNKIKNLLLLALMLLAFSLSWVLGFWVCGWCFLLLVWGCCCGTFIKWKYYIFSNWKKKNILLRFILSNFHFLWRKN